MKYGLIGKNLSHSYSSLIHNFLDSNPYSLLSLNENEFDDFMKNKDFIGINITIPYKEKVIKYLDVIDEKAKEIGAVNVVVNKNGLLYGYNTDYYGLKKLITSSSIDITNRNCFILGNGGTCKTTIKVLKDLNAKSITIVSRQKSNSTITYEEFLNRNNVEIIINTTPVGMYPLIEEELIDIKLFPNLKGVIDVIYNPINTKLIVKSKELGINSIGGLKMLVEQGILSSELFLDKHYSPSICNSLYSTLYKQVSNIVLIGLPMSGKSTIGKELAKKLNKQFIDIDEEIEKEEKSSISTIFNKFGEDYFRKLESKLIVKYSKEKNLIIACGGGVIKNHSNMINLKLNGTIIHLTRDDSKLIFNSSRPLINCKEDYLKLKNERYSTYLKYQDYQIDNSSSIEECVNKIMEVLYENINY